MRPGTHALQHNWPEWVSTQVDDFAGVVYVQVAHKNHRHLFSLLALDFRHLQVLSWATTCKHALIRKQEALDAVTRRLKS